MFCTIINDCLDGNAVGRQSSRVAALLGVTPSFVGVGGSLAHDNLFDAAELEAAGCLIDVLDATDGAEGLVLVNIANRHGKGKRWPNGTPFGYFRHGKTVVVSSVDGCVLSLVKKVGIAQQIGVMDIPSVMNYLLQVGVVSREVVERSESTQFRSFDFTPRVGTYLVTRDGVPCEKIGFDNADFLQDVPLCAWYVDNFGNVKTAALVSDVGFVAGRMLDTVFGEVRCYDRLKDVPHGETGLIVGSSGIGDKRFIEFVVQGKSAAKEYSIVVGDEIWK